MRSTLIYAFQWFSIGYKMEWIWGTRHEIYVQVINFPAKLFKATTRLSPENNNNELVTISKILAFISTIVLRMFENPTELNVLMVNTRHVSIGLSAQYPNYMIIWLRTLGRIIWFLNSANCVVGETKLYDVMILNRTHLAAAKTFEQFYNMEKHLLHFHYRYMEENLPTKELIQPVFRQLFH